MLANLRQYGVYTTPQAILYFGYCKQIKIVGDMMNAFQLELLAKSRHQELLEVAEEIRLSQIGHNPGKEIFGKFILELSMVLIALGTHLRKYYSSSFK